MEKAKKYKEKNHYNRSPKKIAITKKKKRKSLLPVECVSLHPFIYEYTIYIYIYILLYM